MRRWAWLGFSAAIGLALAACGGSDDASGTGGKAGSGGSSGSGGGSAASGGGGTSAGGGGGTVIGGGGSGVGGSAGSGGTTAGGGTSAGGGGAGGAGGTGTNPDDGPPAGNPDGKCAVPAEAQAEDTSSPKTVIGDGTAASCTSAAVVAAVAKGGIITFNCGTTPIKITLTETAKIVNDTGPKIVLDGGGKVTLSGGGKVRILYMNTCDPAQKWTTPQCQNQDHPQLTVQNLTFVDGSAKGLDPDGGGAIFVRGGRFKIVNSRFFSHTCDDVGPDVGGAAVRTLSQYNTLPVYVVSSTFGGKDGFGGVCSNGGGLSSIGVSYTVLNSLFSYNKAIGNGANPAKAGTPGGGSGGAIYNDGNTYTLTLCGVKMTNNSANEGGGAIFFVSNDKSGHLVITDSFLSQNPSAGFETAGYPGIFVIAKDVTVTNSTIQ